MSSGTSWGTRSTLNSSQSLPCGASGSPTATPATFLHVFTRSCLQIHCSRSGRYAQLPPRQNSPSRLNKGCCVTATPTQRVFDARVSKSVNSWHNMKHTVRSRRSCRHHAGAPQAPVLRGVVVDRYAPWGSLQAQRIYSSNTSYLYCRSSAGNKRRREWAGPARPGSDWCAGQKYEHGSFLVSGNHELK